MPAKSKAQQMAAGAALAAKRGEAKVGSLKGASKEMYKSMNQRQLKEFAEPSARASRRTSNTRAASVGFRLRRAGGKVPSR